jgi:N-carbamoyl-L-amino-acid hydrolase
VPGRCAPHAYVELHIEQGPVLEDEGITIGAVTGVQGISWTELTITGQSATPAPRRCDCAATRLRRGRDHLPSCARSPGDGRQPGGHRRPDRVDPNLVNVVPAR